MASKKNSSKARAQTKGVKAAASKNDKKSPNIEEKAITENADLANEQLVVVEPEKGKTAQKAVAPEKKAQESVTAQIEEKAITENPDLANEQLAVVEPERKKVESAAPVVNVEQREEPASQKAKTGPRLPDGISKRPLFPGNPYLPMMATVAEVIRETHNIKTLRVVLDDQKAMADFDFQPGQVGQISVFGAGEATFVINSPPSQKEYLQFSVMRTGEVTDAIHRLSAGDKIGVRAPLGNYFPYQQWLGKNVYFIGGGIGMAPIRTIMLHLLEHKADYGKISLLYGARSPNDMAYSYELDDWKNNPDLDCTLCIDNPHEAWGHMVGLIPTVLEELAPKAENTVAVLCGPPIMIRFTLQSLQKLGFMPENIVTTLEKRMKCGIGICGRCNIGDRYVCVDGPVFTLKELAGLPPDL